MIASHLGKNPIKGGNPPRDKKLRKMINLVFFISVNKIKLLYSENIKFIKKINS